MLVFAGTLIHATKSNPAEILTDAVIGVQNGKILFVGSMADIEGLMERYEFRGHDIQFLGEKEFLIPGFVDTHTHAPQYRNEGTGLDLKLDDWLNTYTFPVEAKYSDPAYAVVGYNAFVKRMLKNGTTTGLYFGTIDVEGTLILCKTAAQYGQRAFVGKVNMDQDSPEYYVETTEQSLKDTERFIQAVKNMNNPLIKPVVTPRYAISCSRKLLTGLGELAAKYDTFIQSHCDESKEEVETVAALYPENDNYAQVYDQSGLMTNKTVMGHGVWVTDPEITIFKSRGTAISHCPNSNMTLRGGLCDLRRLLDLEIILGLGTDIGAGYFPSMLDCIRLTTTTSKIVSLDKPATYRLVDYKEAFRLATLGGSNALAIGDVTGNFEVGKDFDALRISPCADDSPFDIFEKDTTEDIFSKFIHTGDDRNISQVYVAGRKVIDRNTRI